MGKILDHLDLKSIDAVNTLKAEFPKIKSWSNKTWDDLCWPFFEKRLTAVATAGKIGYKGRNVHVENSRQRYTSAIKNRTTQKRKKKITAITAELALTRKLYALFSQISLAEISTQLTNNQRDALMLFLQAMEESWQKEKM